MSDRVDQTIRELERVTQRVVEEFGSLSTSQLNWKSSPKSWSVGQCLDHLIVINGLYFPLFASLREGQRTTSSWERHSPFSALLGRLLIKTLSPGYRRKVKANAKAEPSTSEIDHDIVHRFTQHQAELVTHLRGLSGLDGRATIITSPLLGWVTYSLDDCVTIVSVHEQRHVDQAERVLRAAGFPSTHPSGGASSRHG